MNCERTSDWIWDSARGDEPPAELVQHVEACSACRAELSARRATGRDLQALRSELEEDPPSDLDLRIQIAAEAAVAAHDSGQFPVSELQPDDDLPDDLLDQLADSIAEDFGPQFAAITTGRIRVQEQQHQQGSVPRVPPPERPVEPSAWKAPRATARWMIAASLVLAGTLALGFVAGRYSSQSAVELRGTVRATSSDVLFSQQHRVHRVGLSADGIAALRDGNTYLLAGPVGGPYQVVGVVSWDQVEPVAIPAVDSGEIVVAVGPAGGWSRGKELAVNDLQDVQVEILGRRALSNAR